MKKTKILFMGTPHFAAKALEELLEANFNLVGLITQPDKKVGRGAKIEAPETKMLAIKHNIRVFQPHTTDELSEICLNLEPDLIIVAAYGRKIPKIVLDIPKHKTLNIHGSLLPDYRGASCVARAILDGKTETGITIMEMDEEIDSGPIVSQIVVKIEKEDTTSSLTEKLAEIGAKELVRVIPEWLEGKIIPNEQLHEEATFCSLIRKEDGQIDWQKPAEEIERMVRAFIPWPNAYSRIDNKTIKILKSDISELQSEPGKITFEGKRFFVGTGKGSLEIIRIKPENSKEMSAVDFINGNKHFDGKFFS